jgi:serine/threonine protein kinase
MKLLNSYLLRISKKLKQIKLLFNRYHKAVDIWACGVVMYELITLGEHPILTEMNKKEKL